MLDFFCCRLLTCDFLAFDGGWRLWVRDRYGAGKRRPFVKYSVTGAAAAIFIRFPRYSCGYEKCASSPSFRFRSAFRDCFTRAGCGAARGLPHGCGCFSCRIVPSEEAQVASAPCCFAERPCCFEFERCDSDCFFRSEAPGRLGHEPGQ